MSRPFPKRARLAPSMEQRVRSLIPAGLATILPLTAQRVRHLEDTLLATLGRWGYQEIILPTFEYLDVLSAGLESDVIEKCYKFADRTTGRILLLRPDVTAQVARIVAMGMLGSALPLRLCYRTTVFRYEPEHAGREREIFQAGAELIGPDDVSADGEIIAIMMECLREIGLTDFTISLGHVGFFKGLLAKSGLSGEGQKRAEQAAAKKDLPKLEEVLAKERVLPNRARALLQAPGLYGREEVLEQGRSLAGRDQELRATLDRLSQVYRLIEATGMKGHLLLDLGEFRGFDYYDGVVFDVFADGLGCELGGGGRYNHLIGRFGRDLPSTGFALDVDRLFRVRQRVGNGFLPARLDALVLAPPRQRHRVFQVARTLRASGLRVVQGKLPAKAVDGDRTAVQAAVKEGQDLHPAAVIILGVSTLAADEALVVRGPGLQTGFSGRPGRSGKNLAQKTIKIKDLPGFIRKG